MRQYFESPIFKRYIFYLILILLGLTPLFWFKDNLLIAGGDHSGYLDYGIIFNFYKLAWNAKLNAGFDNFVIQEIFPIMSFWVVLSKIGVSLVNIERIWIVLLFMLPGFSMYYLVFVLEGERRGSSLAGLIAAVLYMFNVYIMLDPISNTFRPVQIALPLILAFWIKGLNSQKQIFLYSSMIGIVSLSYASSNINPPTVAVIPIVLLLYLIFHIVSHKNGVLHILKFTLATIGFYLLLNLWWLSTFLRAVFQQSGSIRKALTFTSLNTGGILEFLRLLGLWAWRASHYKMPYYPYSHLYYEPFLLILSFSIPFLVFLAIILKPKNRNICFFGVLAIIGLFLAKGAAFPFGFLYRWAWENIPGFWIFREPFAKFTPITLLSYSVLLGFSADLLYQRVKNWHGLGKCRLFLSNSIPISVIIILLTVSFPLLTGEVIWDYWNASMRSHYVKVPDYWHRAKEWLNQNDKNSRVFQTPKGGYGMPYNWEHGFTAGDAPAIVLLDNPIVRFLSFPTSYADQITNSVYGMFSPDQSREFISLLALLNTKYILQQNDLDWKFAQKDTYSPEQMRKILVTQTGTKLIQSFGQLDLYMVSDEYFLPHIYAYPR